MSDIFSDNGGEYDLTPTAEPQVETPAANVGSNEGVATETPTEEAKTQQGVTDGQEAPPAAEVKEPTTEELEALEKEAETALADEKTPAWYKNAVKNVYKRKEAEALQKLEAFEPLQQYGSTEEIASKLALMSGLETIRSNPTTGMPELSTETFVKGLYEKDPKVTYQLLNDLANLPSPYTQGHTVLQELFKQTGIDPTHLDDIKTFAANGYQLQQGQYPPPDADDLALIPEHLRPTFAALDPARREAMLMDEEATRNANLEDVKLAMDFKRTQASQQEREEAQKAEKERQDQAAFKNAVDSKGYENFVKSGETVFTSFVDSLAKQANMTPMDSLMIANTVLNSFETDTLAGRRSLEMLKAEGIEIDPVIPITITQMEENSRHIAYYEQIGDRPNMERAVAKQVELQEKLAAKGTKIIASLALKRSNNTAQQITSQNASLAPTNRYAAATTPSPINSNGKPSYDFSDEAYAEQLRAEGFGQR